MTHSRITGERIEGIVQVAILLTIGGVAAAASFTHVHNVAVKHGQPGWLAWADAIVLELMSIGTGMEIRRRHRAGRPAGFVLAVLVAAVALSLAAQVVEAERSIVGWLAAALPALGFLACVKIVLSRTPAETAPVLPSPAATPGEAGDGSTAVPAQVDRTCSPWPGPLRRPISPNTAGPSPATSSARSFGPARTPRPSCTARSSRTRVPAWSRSRRAPSPA